MFYQIFLSPNVKRYVFITSKHGIYQLPHELPNDLRLRILGTYAGDNTDQNGDWYPILGA